MLQDYGPRRPNSSWPPDPEFSRVPGKRSWTIMAGYARSHIFPQPWYSQLIPLGGDRARWWHPRELCLIQGQNPSSLLPPTMNAAWAAIGDSLPLPAAFLFMEWATRIVRRSSTWTGALGSAWQRTYDAMGLTLSSARRPHTSRHQTSMSPSRFVEFLHRTYRTRMEVASFARDDSIPQRRLWARLYLFLRDTERRAIRVTSTWAFPDVRGLQNDGVELAYRLPFPSFLSMLNPWQALATDGFFD